MKSLIIFGPSGVGKGTIVKYLQEKNPDLFQLTLSFTTRQPRKGQVHGYHYNFISSQEFQQKINANQMLEHKVVFGNMYGTSKKSVEQIAALQKIPVLDVDVEGMLDIREGIVQDIIEKQRKSERVKLLDPLCLCIMPPNYKLLRERLSGRKTESAQVVEKRMIQNVRQIERMISIQTMGLPHLFYTANYQYQSTVYGIERWLEKQHAQFATYKKQKFSSYFPAGL